MRAAFLIIIFLHGLIHILGFIKGFGFREIRELTLPISRPIGLMWLTSVILFFTYGVLYLSNNRYAWLIGLIAVLASQVLVILFWKDAKWGTIPNLLIFAVALTTFGYHTFQQMAQRETYHLLSQSKILKEKVISESDLIGLPETVKHWLRNSGVVGQIAMTNGRVTQEAEMKMKPDQKNWMKATAIQYSIIDHPSFIWTVDVKANSALNFQGRDKFEDGKGEMLIKLNSLINVINASGEKLDEGALQRCLGEMVWFPSLAFSPYISWDEVSDTSARATMDYKGTKGSGTFYFDSHGDFIRFSALRFKDNDMNAKRYEWILSVEDYAVFEGIRVPSKMTATWKLEEGDWCWLKLRITGIHYNVEASR